MAYPLPCDENGTIQFATARPIIERMMATASVVAVGPGLGQSDDIRQLVKFLVTSAGKPLVHRCRRFERPGRPDRPALEPEPPGDPDTPSRRVRPVDRRDRRRVQSDRVAQAARLAAVSQPLVVVLKGASTVVTDGSRYLYQHNRQSRDGHRRARATS